MQPITVAITDEDAARRARVEHALSAVEGIRLLANATGSERPAGERRRRSRAGMSRLDDAIACSRRLGPRVLFASIEQCTAADGAFLDSLREVCPETLVVMLADESAQLEERILDALAHGARGCLDAAMAPPQLAKAVQVVDRGEAWVSRRMLGRMMERVALRGAGNIAEGAV